MDYSASRQDMGEERERSLQFSEGRCVPAAMWDILGFPRLPHKANRQTSMTCRRPMFFGRADGRVRCSRPFYTKLHA